jgi:glycosyltransferase involved in cell wall biosynthesis
VNLEPVLVVIPAFNEADSVAAVVRAVREQGFDACVVDDGSTDATAAVADKAGAVVVRMPVNVGVGGALRCGFRYAVRNGYQVAVQVDADGQHHPGEIVRLLERMREAGADMVVGSRFAAVEHGYAVPAGRRFAMRVLARRASHALRGTITDATSGLRAIRRPLLEEFARSYPVEYLGDTVEAMIIAGRSGAKVVECPIDMSPRAAGRASAGRVASAWYVLRVLLAIELMRRRRTVPPSNIPSTQAEP